MVEFRLYYDEAGKVVAYSCGDVEGYDYIVIDASTYAETNPNVRVIDGKIQRDSDMYVTSKLVETDNGVMCEPDDVCVLTDSSLNKQWKIEINEFKRY